ncbi:MAG: hypothetical protein IJ629_05795 [Clostridia bacterium]|nr:hypothetical protein [Clostridia bacterium]
MASNPIKRRARQSFFLGFLIALVGMAVVVMFLFTRINSLNEENEKLKIVGPKVSVYTVTKDIEAGDVITIDDLQSATMQLSVGQSPIDVKNYISPDIFYGYDEETEEEYEITYTSKVKILEGTVVTLSMLQEGGVRNDERLVEYGMIVLPTQLINGDYIDVRLRQSNGTETIVLAKKKVEQCTSNSVWMKMTEDEILTMNSAIVDAYLVAGSQLRATVYTNPLMQDATEETYPVNMDVLEQITYNPNILTEAKSALIEKWRVAHDGQSGFSDFQAKRNEINASVTGTQEERIGKIEEGYGTEATDISTMREEYVSSLEGTGMVGATSY